MPSSAGTGCLSVTRQRLPRYRQLRDQKVPDIKPMASDPEGAYQRIRRLSVRATRIALSMAPSMKLHQPKA